VKTYDIHRSTKAVKQLLIKGANRNTLDNQGGKPSQFVQDSNDKVAQEMLSLLQDNWTLLGDFLMIRTTFKKQNRTPYTLWLYFALMSISFACLYESSFYLLRNHYDNVLYANYFLFALTLGLCIMVWQT
jgi:hypothetical protein